jgi:hypothetical protein
MCDQVVGVVTPASNAATTTNMDQRFQHLYGTEAGQTLFCRLDEMSQSIVRDLKLTNEQFLCLANCFNGWIWTNVYSLCPGAFEIQIEDFAYFEPEQFAQWGVDLSDLLNNIRSLNELQRLALAYCISVWFASPADGQMSLQQAMLTNV